VKCTALSTNITHEFGETSSLYETVKKTEKDELVIIKNQTKDNKDIANYFYSYYDQRNGITFNTSGVNKIEIEVKDGQRIMLTKTIKINVRTYILMA
jgi:uncharacterized protein (UPF0333 family)